MKRENLLLVAGALLASTSITTAANAGTIFLRSSANTLVNTTAVNATNYPVLAISAQAFSSSTANTVTSGSVDLILRFGQQLPVAFNGVITATGAQFANSASTAVGIAFEGTGSTLAGSISVLTNSAVCTSVLATGDKIFLQSCNGAQVLSVGAAAVITASGVVVTGVQFKTIGGLATAGSSISLSAEIYLGTTQTTSIDSTAAAAKVTSRAVITPQAAATTTLGSIDVSATKGAFTALATSQLSAILGTVTLSVFPAFSLDLSTTVGPASAVGSGNEIKLTSAIFSDDATNQVRISGNALAQQTFSTNLSAGYVTLTLSNAQVYSGSASEVFTVTVDFNGSKEIDTAAAGSATVTFVTAGGNGVTTGNATALSASTLTGALSGVTRNGLTIDMNGVYGGGFPITYTSVIRIANSGAVAGSPTIAIYDEATGSLLGTTTGLASIPANGSLQLTAAQIETAAGLTASTKTYRLTVTAGITGYAQQLLWNQTSGFFTDLSSRRNAKSGSTTGQ